jgi:protein O-mannosyl-transferase
VALFTAFATKENIVISRLAILTIVCLSLGAGPAGAGEKPASLRELKQAVAANPQDYQAHYLLGLKYDSLGDTKKAMAEYNKTLSLKPDDEKALYGLGRLKGQLGEFKQAIDIVKKALQANPKSAETRSLLASTYNLEGTALMKQGNLDAAKESLEAGIQAKGGSAETEALRNNLGCLYIRENRPDQAAKTFQEVLRQNPNVAQARYNLALLYYSQGDYQSASRQLYALKGIDRDMAGELSDYRFRPETSTYVAPPVKTMATFPGSPLLTQGTVLPSYAK